MGESSSESVLKLTRHDLIKACRKPTKEDLTCDICGEIFSNLGAKNMHRTKRHKIIKSEADFRLQNRISSNEKKVIPVECSDCLKSFPSMKLAIQHFQKSHMERTISCKLCSKKFAYDRDLKYHLSANKCPGSPKKENLRNGDTSKRKTRAEKQKEFSKSRFRSIETQTDNAENTSDAWSQVYVNSYFPPEIPGMIDQQQQTQFEDFQSNRIESSYAYSVHRDTQTYNNTNTIGTTTPIWPQGYSVAIMDNGTQTWIEQDQTFFQRQPEMIDGFSMTEDNGFQMQ